MTSSSDTPRSRLSTRLVFWVAGFGVSCWAPLVPYAKLRLAVDDGQLGLLLLCLGIGSVTAMLRTSALCARFGYRPVLVGACLIFISLLPALALVDTPWALALMLFGFGGGLGTLDVAINVQAVEVERDAGRPLMSGFHGLFSVGGFMGAASMTGLLMLSISPWICALICAGLMAVVMAVAAPRLLATIAVPKGAALARPQAAVLLLAALAAVMFLVEGALLDWSALLLTGQGLATPARAGIGYAVFSVAMTVGRLSGDRITARFGDLRVMRWGSLLAIAGFAALLLASGMAVALAGFVMIGLGAANVVPILFRRAGAQRAMPAMLAISAVTTAGYAGHLLGPAAIGLLAHGTSLPTAFWCLAALSSLVPLCARRVVTEKPPATIAPRQCPASSTGVGTKQKSG